MNLFTSAEKYINTPVSIKQTVKIIQTFDGEIYKHKIDCIGLILLALNDLNYDIQKLFPLATNQLYKNISSQEYGCFLRQVKEHFAIIPFNNNEIQTNDILTFLINGTRIHFAIAKRVGNEIQIIHANLIAKKISIEVLDEHLGKYLQHIVRV